MVKNLPANAGDSGSIPESGRSLGEGNDNSLRYSCLENSRQRSLAGYSPWGCKESDTIEHTGIMHAISEPGHSPGSGVCWLST